MAMTVAPPKLWRLHGLSAEHVGKSTFINTWQFEVIDEDEDGDEGASKLREFAAESGGSEGVPDEGCWAPEPRRTGRDGDRGETALGFFRRKARVVRILVCVIIALRKTLMEAGLMDTEAYKVTVPGRKVSAAGGDGGDGDTGAEDEDRGVTFTKDDFVIRKELQVPKNLIALFEKEPGERSEDDVKAIGRLMRNNLPSFRKYTKEMQTMMCRIVRYMKCGKRRVVLRKGHVGLAVYFINSGSVSVVLDPDDQTIFTKKEVVPLRKGACFGEIALLQNTRRNATVVCAEETELLWVDRDDFVSNGLHLQLDDEFNTRYSFFRRWAPLEHWTDDEVKAIAYCSRTEDFINNKVLVANSLEDERLWFVMKGACDILRVVDVNSFPGGSLTRAHPVSAVATFVHQGHFLPASRLRHDQAVIARSGAYGYGWDPLRLKQLTSGSFTKLAETLKEEVEEKDKLEEVDEDEERTPEQYDAMVDEMNDRERRLSEDFSTFAHKALSPAAAAKRRGEHALRPHTAPTRRAAVVSGSEGAPGMYVKVDTLRHGNCFGVKTLFPNKPGSRGHPAAKAALGTRYSLVSKGCTVIHIPRSKFMELADSATMDKMSDNFRDYPSDLEVMGICEKKTEWELYKKRVLEDALTKTKSKRITFHGGLRNQAVLDSWAHNLHTPATPPPRPGRGRASPQRPRTASDGQRASATRKSRSETAMLRAQQEALTSPSSPHNRRPSSCHALWVRQSGSKASDVGKRQGTAATPCYTPSPPSNARPHSAFPHPAKASARWDPAAAGGVRAALATDDEPRCDKLRQVVTEFSGSRARALQQQQRGRPQSAKGGVEMREIRIVPRRQKVITPSKYALPGTPTIYTTPAQSTLNLKMYK